MATLLSAAVFITAAQALAFDGRPAQPTFGVIPNPTFQLPAITIPPSIHELAKRQGGDTVLVGPDNTCGFFDGRPGAVYSCNGKDVTCALVTTSTYGAVACCDGDECGLRVACIDYKEFMLSSACDGGCVQDTYTVKCTRASAPYCGTVTFSNGIQDFYCDTVSDSTPQQLYTTYHGETDGRSFTPVVVTLSDDTSTSKPTQTTAGDDDDDDTDTHPSTSGSASQTSGGNNDNSNEESDNSKNSAKKSSSTNVGAIAGGVVGGVAGLALIGVGIFFLVRHNKKKKADAAAAAAANPQMQGPGGPGSPPIAGAPGFPQQPQPPYNPHYSQQYPLQGQPGYYPDPTKPGGFATVAPAQLPDRNDSTSPMSDGRHSMQPPTSPTSTLHSGWNQNQQAGAYGVQQQNTPPPNAVNVPPTVHEAGGNVVGERDYNANHHGQLHELG
ncbi:uncharacterized protein F4822DRAFT_241342 [Hypoxylon trugodes]|uniref:uncharacterized protein n=1 Tax=Hypoxylon trugodes TaxID=326681 RepID=UPI00219377C7|nr:uncharacterized protein F4822DRAFT_241342 [Hypoxylon trugodes]KAI1388299.1 hypothetical protein F4822DRAFT_241342 [Hypoxylon trugodes]